MGARLEIVVEDIAVVLTLCDRHGEELIDDAWAAVEANLRRWRWKPIR
jgi:hypothetical protein